MPEALREALGKREVWRSLKTDSLTVAVRRSHGVAAQIEQEFEAVRARLGLNVDQALLTPSATRDAPEAAPSPPSRPVDQGPSLASVYDAYMADPTRDWSPRTRFAYETTRRVAVAVLGADTPIRTITRAQCRVLIDTLRWLPRHASKLYPNLSPTEIAAAARTAARADLISPSNVNAYLNKFSGVLNWAVKEEVLDRNPAQGLKLPDPTLRREKRAPFAVTQLQAIFSAPLYTGCRDGGHGYAHPGPVRPRNARFWIPLISLFGGLRLNEACQLDTADIRMVEGVQCFVVTDASDDEQSDKRLKTASSARLGPVHPELLRLGLPAFVSGRSRAAGAKLFSEISPCSTGYRSAAFSAWFARFARKAGASSSKTCFHSFRHSFRDALREARVERDIALALGGWTNSAGSSASSAVADAYGQGYRAATLFEAISRVSYRDLDLSHLQT